MSLGLPRNWIQRLHSFAACVIFSVVVVPVAMEENDITTPEVP